MSAQVTVVNSPVEVSAGIGGALDRLAYLALTLFIFALPWEESSVFGHRPIALVLGAIAMGLTVVRIGVTRRRRQLSRLHFMMAAFVALSALSLLWTADVGSTQERVGTYVQMLGVVWMIWEMGRTEARIEGLLRAYTLGILLTACLTIYNYITGVSTAQLDALQGAQQWDTTRFSIVGINENDLGLMIAMSLPMMIYLAARSKGLFARLFTWLQIIPCVAAILLTGSRGALISTAVASLMLPLTIRRLPGTQKLTAILACLCVAACGIYFIPMGSWLRLDQFTTELTQGTLTHRTLIWAAGLSALRNHAFLGVGSGAYPATVFRVIDIPYVAHNTFLSVLVELGVVGAVVAAILLGSLFYTASRMPYLEKILWLTVLSSWSVGVMALTWEYRKPTWVMFGLLAAHAYVRRPRRGKIWEMRTSPLPQRVEPMAVPAGLPRDPRLPEWS